MTFLLALLIVPIAIAAPAQLVCAMGQTTWLSGTGVPHTPLLVYWAGRPVGGGSVNTAGHWAIPLMVGRERPGTYAVDVRSRENRALIGAFTCAVGVALAPSAAPITPTPLGAPVVVPPPPTPLGAAPITDTDCPADHQVKGNIVDRGENTGEKIYHLPGDNGYDATIPERCFATAAEAEAAGYRPVKK